MAALLRELPGSVGFMGSDRYDELDDEDREAIIFEPIATPPIRYAAAYVEPLYFGGSLESKPIQIPRVDGILDVVNTGASIDANRLTIVRDNLGLVSLGAVWNRYG